MVRFAINKIAQIILTNPKKAGAMLESGLSAKLSHGNFTETSLARAAGYASPTSTEYVRPANLRAAERPREDFRNMTMDDVARQAEYMPWGPPREVAERIIAAADQAGAGTVLISLNRGVMPQEMFLEQIRRFAREVLPSLKAHIVRRVPLVEAG